MSFWRGKPGQIAPVALLLLATFLTLPIWLYLSWPTPTAREDNTTVVTESSPAGQSGTGPTPGMEIGPDGFGTVTSAPIKLVPMTAGEQVAASSKNEIARDVARFIRGMPAIESKLPRSDGPVICTLEGPAVWSGHVELRDGCIVFKHTDPKLADALLMLPAYAIGRDNDGYLTVSSPPFTPEATLRVGEREGRFTGKGCSQPSYLPAPEPLSSQCGVDRVINMARLGRLPICSAEELDRLAANRRQYEQSAQRIRDEHERCIANGTPETNCPPGVIPYPIELDSPGCRLPR